MTPHQLHNNNQSLTRQRNVLAGLAGVLVLTNFAISALAAAKEPETILVPTMVSDFQVRADHVPDEYLLNLTRDAATLMLNRHPHDTSYFRDNILRIVEPRFHGAIETSMAADEMNNRYKSGERTFHASDLCRVVMADGALVTEIVGRRSTYVNDRKIESVEIARRFEWTMSGRRIWLRDVTEMTPADSECLKMKMEG